MSICWNNGLELNGILEWTHRILSQRFIPYCKLSMMFRVNFRKIQLLVACKNGLISVSYGLVYSQHAGAIARRPSSQSCIAGGRVVFNFFCFTAEHRSGVLNRKPPKFAWKNWSNLVFPYFLPVHGTCNPTSPFAPCIGCLLKRGLICQLFLEGIL